MGRAIALEFAAEGASVALFERHPATLAETEAILQGTISPPLLGEGSKATRVLTFTLDVTNYAAVRDAVAGNSRPMGPH